MRCAKCGIEFDGTEAVPWSSKAQKGPLPKLFWVAVFCGVPVVAALASEHVLWATAIGVILLLLMLYGLSRLRSGRPALSPHGDLCARCGTLRPRRPPVTGSPRFSAWIGISAYICFAICVAGALAEVYPLYIFGMIGGLLLLCGLLEGDNALQQAKREGDRPKVRTSRYAIALNGIGCVGVLLLVVAPELLYHPHDRERAKQTKSLNNMKQLALGAIQYSEDYGGAFPGWVKAPGGTYGHNVWDQQIDYTIKSKDCFNNGDTGIRSYADPARNRVLTYGLNGLLIANEDSDSRGNADFKAVNAHHPPAPLGPSSVSNPAGTILFAELATNASMPGAYGSRPSPLPWNGKLSGPSSSQWQGALDGWIDISPRAFIEVIPAAKAYLEPPDSTYRGNGVARDLYTGGGCYAFADGHVKFMKLSHTVGIGTVVDGKTVTPENCWESWNTNNMWIPR